MNLFSDMDDDIRDDDWDGGMMSRHFRDNDYPDGHKKSPYKDDGDMKLFKDD